MPAVSKAGRTPGFRPYGAALVQLIAGSALVLAIVVVATVLSVGFARAQAVGAMREPDMGLVLTLLALAMVVMGVLSAAAVRFAGRSRNR